MSGSSNFQVWNPLAANQENDAAYAADAQRSGGATTGLFPSITANKLFYQLSTMVAAIGAMLAAKGYTVADSDLVGLTATLENLLDTQGGNLTGAINEASATVAAAATMNIGAANAAFIDITGSGQTITAFDGIQKGTARILYFEGANTFTHSASLVCPGNQDLSVSAGDIVIARSMGGGTWTLVYLPASGWMPADGTLTKAASGLKVTPNIFAALAGSSGQVFNAAAGTSGSQVVNLGQFAAGLGGSGYQKLPSGLIFQWGITNALGSRNARTITLPISFPTAFVFAGVCRRDSGNGNDSETLQNSLLYSNAAQPSGLTQLWIYNGAEVTQNIPWFAIGY